MRMISGALMTAICCTGLAWAQQPGDQARFDADRFLKDHDRNNDGKLSKEELPQQLQQDFGEVDTNKDGALSADELRQHAQKMSSQRPPVVEILYWVIDVPEQEPASADELQRAYELLRKMDKDNNGKLDSQEVKSFRDEREKQRVDHIFQSLDRNSDGKVSKEEARGIWADHFAEIDKNNDGQIDKQEIMAACRMKREQGQQGQPGQPGTGQTRPQRQPQK